MEFRREGTLQCALEVCNRRRLTRIILRSEIVENDIINAMNLLQKHNVASSLQGAVLLGYHNITKHLLGEGAMLTSSSNVSHALCIALQESYHGIARLLIKSGADVNLAFEERYPLDFALEKKKCNVEIVKEIIESGFPKNGIVHKVSHRTALHSAVRMNNFSVVTYLLEISADPNVRDIKGRTPLHYAVQKNYHIMMKLLVSAGAIIDCECLDNFTPMMYAIATGSCDMIKLLLSLGSDIHYSTRSTICSMMPLHFAVSLCDFKITQFLLENGAELNRPIPFTGETPLHTAARADTKNLQQKKVAQDYIVQYLIEKGANLRARHTFGATPLQVSIKAKNMNVAKNLIISGSELNIGINDAEDQNYTTFHIASKSFDKDLIRLCIDYGADCHKKDDEGLYPIHLALLTSMLDSISHRAEYRQNIKFCSKQSEQIEIFKMFWAQGFPCDLTLKMRGLDNENPPFPTKIAAQIKIQKKLFNGVKSLDYNAVVKAILQGAEVNSCCTEMLFPLHFIASNGNYMMMKLFVARGVPVNLINADGQSPLHLAAKYGHLQCCLVLLEFGAVYNYRSERYPKTPLKLAKENQHYEVAVLLTMVNKYFKDLKSGHINKLKPNMKVFRAVIHCCSRDGSTLFERALQLNMKDLAKQLLVLRQKYPVVYSEREVAYRNKEDV